MIITVSPNVALDRVHVVQGFRAGEQSRAIKSFFQPGGSGVHAAEVIQALGGQSIALGLVGGKTGELWEVEAQRCRLAYDMVPIYGETRESFCLIDLDLGNIAESVEEGPNVEPNCVPPLLERLEQHLHEAELLILSGSVPPGFPGTGYEQMLETAKSHNVRVLADLHGSQLKHVLRQGPWLVKPSLHEFHELIGYATSGLKERARACEALYREWDVVIALSMADEGMLVTGPEGQWLVEPPRVEMRLPGGRGRNVIGCGDALVGALAYEYCATRDLLRAARLGVAAAHSNLGTFGVPEIDAEETQRLVSLIEPACWAG